MHYIAVFVLRNSHFQSWGVSLCNAPSKDLKFRPCLDASFDKLPMNHFDSIALSLVRQRLHGANRTFGRSNIWPLSRSVHTGLVNRPQIGSLRLANIRSLRKATLGSVYTVST